MSWRRGLGGVLVLALVAVGVTAVAPPAAAAPPVCEAVRPDAEAAALMARSCGQRVEVLAGRSERTQVFVNPDGSSTFTSSVVPVRVHRPDGSWVPVDATLRARADGWLAPVAAVTDMAFSAGGPGPFATFRDRGALVTLDLGVTLPRPRLEGPTAVYSNVLPDVDLRVTASESSFRHVLVVKTAAAAGSPALAEIRVLVGGDVTAAPAGDGTLRFTDKAGRTIATSQPASMWDSSVNPGENGEITPAAPRAVLDAMRARPTAELVSTEDGPGVTSRTAPVAVRADVDGRGLRLTPDAALLRGPGTVLPLFIDPAIGPPRSAFAYTRSTNGDYTMDGKAWVGKNPPCCGGDGSVFRAFFGFPTTYGGQTYKGKQILSASFSVELYHSYSCGDTVANAFRTDGVYVGWGGRMDWNARPLGSGVPHLGAASGHANKAGGCGAIQPDTLMTFGGNDAMRNDVQAVANANWDTYTIGVCACDWDGGNESAQDRWKKFYVDERASMSVTYNTVPGTPANLSPHQGQIACGGAVGTTSPAISAQYVDADGSDTLSASFKWQQLPSGAVTTVAGPAKPANNTGSVTLNLGASAEGKTYQFQMQTNDGHAASPWSAWCQFTVDSVAPTAPIVTAVASGSAPVYSSCPPGTVSSCTPQGGPGVAGAFRFSEPAGPAGQDVTSYVYGWDSPSITTTVAPGSQSAAILLTPPHYGLNKLTVKSVDPGGHASPITNYFILVAAPSAPLAHWPLDSINGHDLNDVVSNTPLTATGHTWTADARYIGANALTVNGSGSDVSQTVSSFDTSGSFSVSAWVRMAPNTCSGNQSVVSIDGDPVVANNHASAFYLGYDCTAKRWRMRVADKNVAQPWIMAAVSPDNSAVAGRWTLLVGAYDEAQNKLSLWVDGALAQTMSPEANWVTSHGAGWKATGPVTVGHDRWNDLIGGRFTGEVAEVRLWNRVLVGDDITGTNADPVNGVPAQPGLTTPLQVGGWAFPDGECFCGDTPDSALFSRSATLMPNWTLDPNWSGDPATTAAWFTADSHDGNGGLKVNGSSGYASTADDMDTLTTSDDVQRPVLRTDQSMTLAAWANLDTITNVDQVVVNAGPLSLFFRGWEHKWGSTVSLPNGSGGWTNYEARSNVVAAAGGWVHLVGVYDAGLGQVRIYVNGVQQTVVATGAVSATSTGSLLIGKKGSGFYFGGTIDDVRVYQGVLNAREITNLYTTS